MNFSYGFHKSHCVEALELTDGDVGMSLEVLLSQYFQLGLTFPFQSEDSCEDEKKVPLKDVLQQREEEKCALESIYDVAFEERIANRLWVLNLQLDYLLELYSVSENQNRLPESREKVSSRKPQPEFCRFVSQHKCGKGRNQRTNIGVV